MSIRIYIPNSPCILVKLYYVLNYHWLHFLHFQISRNVQTKLHNPPQQKQMLAQIQQWFILRQQILNFLKTVGPKNIRAFSTSQRREANGEPG